MIDDLKSLLDSDQLTFTEMADGTAVLLDLDGHQVLSLNSTGTQIVRDIFTGASSNEDLVRGLTTTFDIDERTANQDIAEFLEQLKLLLTGKAI